MVRVRGVLSRRVLPYRTNSPHSRVLPPRSATATGTDGDFAAAASTEAAYPHSEPIPSRDAPVEFNIYGRDRGLHKYTGFSSTPYKCLSSFKLWSHGPLPGPPLEHTRRFESYFGIKYDGQTPRSATDAFEYLYNVAVQGLKSHDNVQATFAQLFFRPRGFAWIPQKSSSLLRSGGNRNWNLSCLISRSTSSPGGWTRPWFMIQTENNHFVGSLQTKDTHLPWDLKITIGGFLKPDIAPAKAQNAGIPPWKNHIAHQLQSVVDAYLQEVAATVYGRRFTTVADLVTAVRLKLEGVLPLSAVPKALDMFSLELSCAMWGHPGTRYVDSVLLNANGTVKHKEAQERDLSEPNYELLQSASDSTEPKHHLPELESEPSKPDHRIDATSTNMASTTPQSRLRPTKLNQKLPISVSAVQKLGIGSKPYITVSMPGGNEPEYTQVRDNFDLACRMSNCSGLRCWSHALVETSRSLAPHVVFRLHKSLNLRLSNSRLMIQAIKGQRLYIWLKLPGSVVFDAEYRVNLRGRIEPQLLEKSTLHNISTKDEITFLVENVRSTLSRVCSEMSFPDPTARLRALAEAILRVVEFPTSAIVLSRVTVVEVKQKGMENARAQATWKDNGSPLPRALAKEQAECEVVFATSAFGNHVEQDPDDEPNSYDVDDEADPAADMTLATPDSTTQSADDVPDDSTTRYDPNSPAEPVSPLRDDDAELARYFPAHERESEQPDEISREDELEPYHPRAPQKVLGKGFSVDNMTVSETSKDFLLMQQSWVHNRTGTTPQATGALCMHLTVSWSISRLSNADQHRREILENARTLLNEEFSPTTGPVGLRYLWKSIERLSARLPLHPVVSLTVKGLGQKGNINIRAGDGIRGRTPLLNCRLPMVYLSQERLQHAESPMVPQTFELAFHMQSHIPNITDFTEVDIPTALDRLKKAIVKLVEPIVRLDTSDSTRVVAHACATAVSRSSQPLLGFLRVDRVNLIARTVNSKGEKGSTEWVHFLSSSSNAEHDVHGRLPNRVYVALGSNVGDRFEAITSACRLMDASEEIDVLGTSSLYETRPMYVEDQSPFLNGVCTIATSLTPIQLLDKLQVFENSLGRVKLIDKGPRNIDLDVLLYNNETIDTERLTVPHRLMLEREFALRPFCELSPDTKHPKTQRPFWRHLEELPSSDPPMYTLTPLGPHCDPVRTRDPRRATRIMSILNVTPDSFSDGGINQATDMEALKATISSHIAAGATIIDVGGQSSRPNASDITAEEEIARILPAIEAIKMLPGAQNVAISVDTYRAAVAEAAIKAGAHIVNDISAGTLDPEMLPTIARLGCTYIMMHMRGTPATMQNEDNTSYPDGVIPTIAKELKNRLRAARNAGIRRWRIILDPGLGFAKTVEQNVEILRNFSKLRNSGAFESLPWLVGSSRKGFIGKITGVSEPKDRVSGTAATVTAAIQGGAEIIRVHDVAEMAQVAKMADEMYRSG